MSVKSRIAELNTRLADTLTEKGVQADGSETTTALIDKVAQIPQSGGDSFYDLFWDVHQCNGERSDYKNAFSAYTAPKAENYKYYPYWNELTFKPKYDIKPTSYATEMLHNFRHSSGEPMDLEQHLKDCGVSIDMSSAIGIQRAFAGRFSVIPEIVCKDSLYDFDKVFYSCDTIETIRKITVGANTGFTSSFHGCTGLKNITFGGTIGKGISFASSSLLTVESVQSIINALADYSGTENEFVYSVTFHETTKELIEAEGATSPNGNTWLDYIDDKGWNY